jgi:hypothetical protein
LHVVAEHVNEVSEDRIRAVLLDPFPAGVFPAAECWLPVSVVGPAHSSRSKSSSLAGGCSTTSRRRCAYVIPSAPPRYRSLACVPGSGVKTDLLINIREVQFGCELGPQRAAWSHFAEEWMHPQLAHPATTRSGKARTAFLGAPARRLFWPLARAWRARLASKCRRRPLRSRAAYLAPSSQSAASARTYRHYFISLARS